MADIRVKPGEGPGLPERRPQVSAKLAHNVALTDAAAKDAWLTQGFAELKDRVTIGPIENRQ